MALTKTHHVLLCAGLALAALLACKKKASCPAAYKDVPAAQRATFECTCSGEESGSVWGSGIYTSDSNLCTAAVHAGVASGAGSKIKPRAAPGCAAYVGSMNAGVSTGNWGAYSDSFYFEGVGSGVCPVAPAPAAAPAAPVAGGTCPQRFQDVSGDAIECTCGGGEVGSVWGVGPYTADSNLCAAARHVGAVTSAGGKVKVKAAPGCKAYSGTTANGVTTGNWGSYQRSFVFEGFGAQACP